MKLSNEIFKKYLEKVRPKYDGDVLSKILSKECDKGLAEKSVIDFYTKKNDGIKPIIRWVDNPLILRDELSGQKIKMFSSYLNINWLYFYFTFIDHIKENDIQIKNEYYDFDKKIDVYEDSKLIFNMLVNSFGVCEISGFDKKLKKELKYKEIILIKKPKSVSLLDYKLHSIKGPAFDYDKIRFYYLEGINFDESMWIRIIKTALSNPNSPINDILKEKEKLKLKKFITILQKINGQEDELSPTEILSINNIEIKSKVIKYVGIDKVMEFAEVISEQPVTTSNGDIINYQLFEIQLGLEPDNIPSRFVKVICWSTGKEYILQVDPRNRQCETPLGAIAWTCIKPDGNHCTIEEYLQLQFQS